MTLDLSQYENSADTPELAAFKKTVETVAKKYAKKNQWCNEVDKALAEMGIKPQPDITIDVTTVHGLKLPVLIGPSLLVGKTEAQQKQAVAKVLGTLTISAGGRSSTTLSVAEADIVDMALSTEPIPAAPAEHWYYTSNAGRVLHYFRYYPADSDGRTRGEWYTQYANCGQTASQRNLTQDSPRGTGTRCDHCARSAG